MTDQRKLRANQLQQIIEGMDAGILQITVYKGMPVKIRVVSEDIVLDGESALNLNDVAVFSPRKWWVKKALDTDK